MPNTRRIMLIDADAFFVSVARQAYPDVAQAPYLLVGGPPKTRSIVSSASYEARKLGIHAGMSMDHALRLCPKAIQRPVPWDLCRTLSQSIRDIISEMAPLVEGASIDEWYADFTGTEALYDHQDLTAIALVLRSRIKSQLNLSVSIGCGTNKLVAKMAAEHAKPGQSQTGVYEVRPGEEASFLAPHSLLSIPGIGPKFSEKLARFGLKQASDIIKTPQAHLEAWFGERMATFLYQSCRGQSDTELVAETDAQSISRDTTFPEDLPSDAAWAHMVHLIDNAVSDLRRQSLTCRTVVVKIRAPNRTDHSQQRTIPPTSDELVVRSVAKDLFESLALKFPSPLRFASVALKNFAPAPEDTPSPVSEAMDAIRARFGKKSIRWAITPPRKE